jgi:hypothetical protein
MVWQEAVEVLTVGRDRRKSRWSASHSSYAWTSLSRAACSNTLNMEAAGTSETLVRVETNTLCHILVELVFLFPPWERRSRLSTVLQIRSGLLPGVVARFTEVHGRSEGETCGRRSDLRITRACYRKDLIRKTGMGRACNTYGESRGACRVLVWKPEGRNHLEDPGVDGRIILKWIFREVLWRERARTGTIWLGIGTCDGLLWVRWWTFRFYKMRRISWVAE